jgi:hypothetical protein
MYLTGKTPLSNQRASLLQCSCSAKLTGYLFQTEQEGAWGLQAQHRHRRTLTVDLETELPVVAGSQGFGGTMRRVLDAGVSKTIKEFA